MEKRIADRYEWFDWAYQVSGEKEFPIGYVMNISETGVNLWIDQSKVNLNDKFTIRIRPPQSANLDCDVDLNLHKMWVRKTNTITYYEMGCNFSTLGECQKQAVQQLLRHIAHDQVLV